MIQIAVKLSRWGAAVSRNPRVRPIFRTSSQPLRFLHDGTNGPGANPVAVQMINYALSHARSQKSDESYAQGMLILEQCLSTQPSESEGQFAQNSIGTVLLAMSNLLYERGSFAEAIEKLHRVQDLAQASLGVRVAAMEALVGLHLQSCQDDTSSVLADKCLELLDKDDLKSDGGKEKSVIARAKAVKGLVELVSGNLESAASQFEGLQDVADLNGSVALSYGQYLHAVQSFSQAKELYKTIIERMPKTEDFSDINALAVCNMAPDEVLLAATFALGQLESHMGKFDAAEEILTKALTKTEEHFGSNHPKVGVVLTCIALMFQNKARQEHSSSLLIQEGLYRRALEFLKAPPLESKGAETKLDRRDILALARGGYAEVLCVQQNRKAEGEKMKTWAEAAWRNRRLSLANALDISEPSSKVPVIDARTSRVL
ncbi:Tetratricopeptide-like helical [Corchorus capsularis]|uniref:Tetratricopeptide-like helical n=1 Tax=Corchorus capsularis TaxID=210143 RepID=A0A1R3H7V5_COCAP|nr:Tetratricopeptide-like helical [Corchorus capsularis]